MTPTVPTCPIAISAAYDTQAACIIHTLCIPLTIIVATVPQRRDDNDGDGDERHDARDNEHDE